MTSLTNKNVPTGKKHSEMRADAQAWHDVQTVTTSCVCGWTFTGTAVEGRTLAAEHRAESHPEIKARRRRRDTLKVPTTDPEHQEAGRARGAVTAAALLRLEEVA